MPLRGRKQFSTPSIFFVTTSTYNHRPFPDRESGLKIVEDILFDTVRDKNIDHYGYVIMPTHIHLVIGSKNGGPGISRFMHSLKGRIREVLAGKGKFWQERFDDLLLLSNEQLWIKINYIHFNPVRAGLVEDPADWPYSGYRDWQAQGGSRGLKFSFDGTLGPSGEVT